MTISPAQIPQPSALNQAAGDPPGFRFGSKGGTLAALTGRVTQARLCDQILFPVRDWHASRLTLIGEIVGRFASMTLAVRSCTTMEDTWNSSNAGAFLSLTGVRCEADALAKAVDDVVASYGESPEDHEVLVQPMVAGVALSGVVLTRDLDTGAPYYVINYDDYSGRTDTVTGGAISKTVAVHRTNPDAIHSVRMRKLVAAIKEIERLTGCEELDVEFCVTDQMEVYILQVRPLAARHNWHAVSDSAIDEAIAGIRGRLRAYMTPADGLFGRTTIFGEMPDWNPAEMIGATPRPLALSLYRKLITDAAWSEARRQMGYRHVPRPLLVDFAGRPYIDVRLSLNSFLPADVDPGFAHRLVDFQLEKLAAHPEWHDKIEFEVARTCSDFDGKRYADDLSSAGFAAAEIGSFEAALRRVTARAIESGATGIGKYLAMTDRILHRDPAPLAPDALGRARTLFSDCVPSGTVPFAILARHAFIGIALLKSLVRREVLRPEDVESFLLGIHTVASDLIRDMAGVSGGQMSLEAFLATYGHLRPGTYDILSWRYDEHPETYFGNLRRPTSPVADRQRPALTPAQYARIGRCLAELGLAMEPGNLLDYIAAAVAAREQAKFAFTRSISDALVALCAWGEEVGLSREDLSYLPIDLILNGHPDAAHLRSEIERRRGEHQVTRAIRLPHLIAEPDDIDVVRLPQGQPTFITSKAVTAPIVVLHSNEAADLEGCIVFIESADPGFDWIFSHRIVGLVTKYGGANSHMAIRCAEFGLPAAIGCGAQLFERLVRSDVVELNGAARKISAH